MVSDPGSFNPEPTVTVDSDVAVGSGFLAILPVRPPWFVTIIRAE